MKRHIIAVALVPWLVFAARGKGQETYQIRIKAPGEEGKTYLYQFAETKKTFVKTVDGDGATLIDSIETAGKTSARRVTILKWAADAIPAAGHVVYEKATTSADGVERTSPLQGKKISLELQNDELQLRLEDGKDLTEEQLADLELNDFYNSAGLSVIADPGVFPKKAVKIGETWSVSTDFVNNGRLEKSKVFDVDKATYQGKLVKVYQKDGRQFGTVEFTFELPFKHGPLDKHVQLVNGKMTFRGTFDGCIDGTLASASMKSTQGFQMEILEEALGVRATTDLRVIHEGLESHEEAKK